ncbi:MAG TPA: VTT domain-containing protein [Chryseolinea sp.]|nr:VTT domain-containing protein [Chryseolinea sp.]HPM29616.1 VTT domain-containing protein [Chryseolinea sp.]
MNQPEEETQSGFLLKNLVRGLIWLVVILVAFIYAEDFIQENFTRQLQNIKDKPLILYSIFFGSEAVFGLIPPVLFMTTWKLLLNVSLSQYVVNLSILSVISFGAGVLGYFIGKYFSRTRLYRKLEYKYFRQYNRQLKKYGSFLVLVGALTPVPFSATCMLAGSVAIPFKQFLLACSARVFYFVLYGWIVWSFPNLFQ